MIYGVNFFIKGNNELNIKALGNFVEVSEQVLDENAKTKEGKLSNGPYTISSKLKIDQTSNVEDLDDSFVLYKCIGRTQGKYKDFDKIKDSVKSYYADEKYDELLKSESKIMQIQINDSVYNEYK